jgi:hypothetical protein
MITITIIITIALIMIIIRVFNKYDNKYDIEPGLTCPCPVTLPMPKLPQVCCDLASSPVVKALNTPAKRRSMLNCSNVTMKRHMG